MDAANLLRLACETTHASAESLDTELLRRYATERDEDAFTELVRRNGPIVLRACRNVLGEAGAEDAFQATFLLLLRSAGRLSRPGSLAGWLHAAAVRIARQARRGESRRRRHERGSDPTATAPDDLTWREVREVLDTELAALPEKYRIPLVLCYLQELSYEEAARLAGCPVGALRGRLERGKDRLRKRLARYGLPLAAPALVLGLPSPVSAALAEATLATVRAAASGGPVPAAVSGLIGPQTGLRVSLLAPLVITLATVGAVLALGDFPADDKPKGDPPKAANPVAEAAPQPAVDRLGDPLPPGAVARLGTRRLFGPAQASWAAYSPDGTRIAVSDGVDITVCDATTGRPLIERKANWITDGHASAAAYSIREAAIGWRADGTGVAVAHLLNGQFVVWGFTNPHEKPPALPPDFRLPDRMPWGSEFAALSPDATRLAITTNSGRGQFTITMLPATAGKPVSELKPIRTLGPFAGPCREVRYTARGIVFSSWEADDRWKEGDLTISLVDSGKNAIARTITIRPPAGCVGGGKYCLSPDTRFVAVPFRPKVAKKGGADANTRDGMVRVWDLENGKEIHSIPIATGGYSYETTHAFTPDGKKLIVSGVNPYIQVWEVATGKEMASAPNTSTDPPPLVASAVAVRPDGEQFATARWDGRIDTWDATTAKPLLSLDTHRNGVYAAAVSPDGRLAATLDHDDVIRVWELATGNPVRTLAAPRLEPAGEANPGRRFAFAPGGRGLVFTSGAKLASTDPLTGKSLDLPGRLRGFEGTVSGFAADGKTLVTVAKDRVTLWDWPAGTARLTITVPLAPRNSGVEVRHLPWKSDDVVRVDYPARISPDGQFLFTSSFRKRKDGPWDHAHNANDVWDARTGKHLHRLEKPDPWYSVAGFSPDGRVLYLGGHNPNWEERGLARADTLTAWDSMTGKLLRRFVDADPLTSDPQITALALSPDGRLLANRHFASDCVWVHETASGRPLKSFCGHGDGVNDLAFTPDGRRLVSVSSDQTGLVWDMTLPVLTARRGGKPTEKELADAWERLSGADPVPAYLGIAALVAAPAEAIPLLKAKLRPAPVPTNADLDRLAAKLGANEAVDREEASAELERFGPNAVAWARARLAGTESPEVRDRLRRFLARYDGPNPPPYELRCVRGVAALEAIGTPEAKELLRELAKVKADTLTREALAALERLGNR